MMMIMIIMMMMMMIMMMMTIFIKECHIYFISDQGGVTMVTSPTPRE